MSTTSQDSFWRASLFPITYLLKPSDPVKKLTSFVIQADLLGGYALLFTRQKRDGTTYVKEWHAGSAAEAILFLHQKLNQKLFREGYQIVQIKNPALSKTEVVTRTQTNSIHAFRSAAEKSHSKSLRTRNVNDNMWFLLRQHLTRLSSMTENSSENVVRLAFPSDTGSLNKSLRSIFGRDRLALKAVFDLENDGLFFLGDLVQLKKAQLDLYTHNSAVSERMLARLENHDLSLNMAVPRWRRPFSLGNSL